MPHRFLIADHDPLVREECRRFLSAHGHEVRVAADALQCLEGLRGRPSTVLVLDPRIMWGGGAGLLEWLRDEPWAGRVTVVVSNGETLEEIPEGLHSLVTAHVPRPTSLRELVRFVARLEEVARTARPHRKSFSTPNPSRRTW